MRIIGIVPSYHHSAFLVLLSVSPFVLAVKLDTVSNALFEYPCIVSQSTRSAALFE